MLCLEGYFFIFLGVWAIATPLKEKSIKNVVKVVTELPKVSCSHCMFDAIKLLTKMLNQNLKSRYIRK